MRIIRIIIYLFKNSGFCTENEFIEAKCVCVKNEILSRRGRAC